MNKKYGQVIRQSIYIIIVLLLTLTAFAQPSAKELQKHKEKVAESARKKTVVLSLDTLYNEGVPYCLYKVAAKILWAKEYSVQTLSGKEILYIKGDCVKNPSSNTGEDCFTSFLFMQSSNKAEVQASEGKIEKMIVENNLIKDGAPPLLPSLTAYCILA